MYDSLLTACKGMMSAAASLGLSLLWDTDVGLSHVDKYTYSSEEHIKVRLILCLFFRPITNFVCRLVPFWRLVS